MEKMENKVKIMADEYNIYVVKDIMKDIMNMGFRCMFSNGFFIHEYKIDCLSYKIPTAEEVCGWLREEYNVNVYCRRDPELKDAWRCCIENLKYPEYDNTFVTEKKYEDALMQGIRCAVISIKKRDESNKKKYKKVRDRP